MRHIKAENPVLWKKIAKIDYRSAISNSDNLNREGITWPFLMSPIKYEGIRQQNEVWKWTFPSISISFFDFDICWWKLYFFHSMLPKCVMYHSAKFESIAGSATGSTTAVFCLSFWRETTTGSNESGNPFWPKSILYWEVPKQSSGHYMFKVCCEWWYKTFSHIP